MTMKFENQLMFYWRGVQLDLRDKQYFDALIGTYYIMLGCVVAAIVAILALPFLLPALFVLLVAKLRSRLT
jgi:hypothetical protein